jgi:hypothetical protein
LRWTVAPLAFQMATDVLANLRNCLRSKAAKLLEKNVHVKNVHVENVHVKNVHVKNEHVKNAYM